MTKDHFIFGFFLQMKFQNHCSEYDHGLLWIMHLCMECTKMKELNGSNKIVYFL
jgi:hypothetical protein